MRTLWLIVLVCVSSALSADLTLVSKETGAEVVEAVIDIIDQSCVFSTDDRQMLRRIAKLETDDGNADDTFVRNDEDYYGGIWNVNQAMFTSALLRYDLYIPIINAFAVDLSKLDYTDLVLPLYSGLVARIFIDSNPEKGNVVPWNETAQAQYWVNEYHKGETGVSIQDYLDVIDQLETGSVCEVSQADIVFVLDGSGSIGAGNFQIMLLFVQEVVEAFDVRADGVHIGVIKYSADSKTEFYLGEITDKQAVKTEVQRIAYEQGGTNTAAALDDLRDMFARYGRGSGVPQIAVVLTDGASNDPAATVTAAQKVHDDKLTVFAIGVTSGAVVSELQAIGSDPDCIHVHLLNSFSDISPFTSTIQSQACRAPAELDPGNDFDGSIVTGSRVFFKVKLRRGGNGVTIKLRLRTGGGRLFISFKARNPGRAFYKYQLRVDSSFKVGGRLHIKYPTDVDDTLEYVEAFIALMGDGFGLPNLYTIGMNEGSFNAAAGLAPMTLSLLAGVLMAVLGVRM